MRLSTRSSLALRLLMLCAETPATLLRKREAARTLGASENHLGLVINQLGKARFLVTKRGRNGGFTLARPASEISIGAVLRQVEKLLPFLPCAPNAEICSRASTCALRDHLLRAVEAFYTTLDPLRLSQLDAQTLIVEALVCDGKKPSAKLYKFPCVSARG